MEKNPREAILNNIQGTLNLADLAVQFELKKFILISTDKAVKPSSIMGATKRVCEMIVSAYGQTSDVQFAAVRFGNVLGSRGSLIPLLTAQIRRGGPVTVTHKDMTRFFMTIPEAVQLVLQAGAMGERGEVFILDMGEPVKILDLANELIRMHELVPGQDIEIKFTGMRPGEKLHEELVYEGEDLRETAHKKIRAVGNLKPLSVDKLRGDLGIMKGLFDDPERLVQYLQDLAWEKNSTVVKKTVAEKPPVRLD
jgi:FlaA1/EpsC-like NDP-sugar epimerase